jgi:hypothetical protein
MDDTLFVTIGLRAPVFKRELNQYCLTQNNGFSVLCTSEPVYHNVDTDLTTAGLQAATNLVTLTNVPIAAAGTTRYATPFSAEVEYKDVLPNVGVSYQIAPGHTVFVSYAEGLSAPRTDNLYTAGVAQLDIVAMTLEAKTPFKFLHDPANQELALDTVASDLPEFYRALPDHTIEGTFAAPEYGGNAALRGWRLARYDGDSAPRGHAVYDASIDAYVDRRDQPTTQPSPGDVSEDFSDDVIALLTISALGTGGKRFF